jgi:hypothetical protein
MTGRSGMTEAVSEGAIARTARSNSTAVTAHCQSRACAYTKHNANQNGRAASTITYNVGCEPFEERWRSAIANDQCTELREVNLFYIEHLKHTQRASDRSVQYCFLHSLQ